MGKNANVIAKKGRKLTDYEMLDEVNTSLMHQLDDESERCDDLLGMLAVERDLVGQIVIGLYQQANRPVSQIKAKVVTSQIDKLLGFLTPEQKVAANGDVEFHLAAIKLNKSRPDLVPAWRDDHPLYLIGELNFWHVVNRYYGPGKVGQVGQ